MLITWIVFAIVLVLGITIALFAGILGRRLRRSRALISFLSALLASFAGVFLAFSLANYQVESQERRNLESLLNQAQRELKATILITEQFYDSLSSETDDLLITDTLDSFPFSQLITLDTLFSSPLMPKYNSPYSGWIIHNKKIVDNLLFQINSPELPPRDRLGMIPPYLDEIAGLKEFLLIELEFIRGNMTIDEVEQRYDEETARITTVD